MERTLQASLHHTQVCKCISVAVQLGWTHHWTSGNHFWSHHTIKQSLGPMSPVGFPQNVNIPVEHMTGMKTKTSGSGLIQKQGNNQGSRFCVTCTRLPLPWTGALWIFGHVIQDFLHNSTSPLGTGRRDFFFLVKIQAVGNAALSTCGVPQGRSVCVFLLWVTIYIFPNQTITCYRA